MGLPADSINTDGAERRPTRFWQIAARAFRWVRRAAPVEFSIVVVVQLVGSAAVALVLISARAVADSLTADVPPSSVRDIGWPLLGLAVGLFLSGMSLVVQREGRLVVSERVLFHLQEEIIDVTSSVDFEAFEDSEFNDLRDRAVGQGVRNALQLVYDLIALVSSLATSVALLFVLAAILPTVLPVLALVAVPFVFAARASARIAFRMALDLTPEDRLRGSLFSALVNRTEAKEVRIFDLRRPLRARWARLFDDRIERVRRVAMRRLLFNGIASAAASLLVAGLLVVIVDAAVDGRVDVADAAIGVVALQQVAVRIRTIAGSSGSLRESAMFIDDFERFRSLRIQHPDDEAVQPLAPFDTLRVEGVGFRYPGTDRSVLEDIDLEIRRGEIVALVGASGSGKTTLAHLVAGLYRPTEGTISWGDFDIASISRRRLWRSIGIVYQDYVRYQLTARENISISDHARMDDLDAIRLAAERASIATVIDRLPFGFDSMLSRAFEGGQDLSGGEWQRVAVARAFFREAPLIILDEPAAALDAMAERHLYEQLVQLCVDRSALLISHRFSTVRMAHKIYVLQDGRIVERGTHAELMALDGHYAAMFNVQAAGFVDS